VSHESTSSVPLLCRSYVRLRDKSKKLLSHQSHFPCGLIVGKSLMFLAIVPRARLDRLTADQLFLVQSI